MRKALPLLLLLLPLHAWAQPADADPAVERVGAMAPRSVVVVRCGDTRVGTAFAFGEAGRVATARHVAECPRGVSVETLDGRRSAARVLTMGEEHDLAVLVLEDDLRLEPLGVRDSPVRTGLQVYAVGFPAIEDDDGRVSLTATRGVVGQVQADVVYSDVTVSPGSSGGPLVDAELRLVGLVYATNLTGVSLAVPSRHLVPVVAYADDGGDARSPITLDGGVHFGLWVDEEGPMVGGRAELGLALHDEWTARLGLGAYANETQQLSPEPSGLERLLITGSAHVGYRFRFGLGDGIDLTLEATLGVQVAYQHRTDTTYAIGFADPACDPSVQQCAITSTATSAISDGWSVRPTAGLRLGLGDLLHVGYEFQLDVETPEASSHLVTFGIDF